MTDYFKSSSQTPNTKDKYKTVADISHDITLVDSLGNTTLEMDTLDSINTMMASGAMNALLANVITLGRTSTPKRKSPQQSISHTPTPGKTATPKRKSPEPSASQTGLKKKLKMTAAAALEQIKQMRDSDVSSLDTTESDTQSLISLQE